MSLFTKEPRRVWGRNKDGSPYAIGMTVGSVGYGGEGQIWLTGGVIDESLE